MHLYVSLYINVSMIIYCTSQGGVRCFHQPYFIVSLALTVTVNF